MQLNPWLHTTNCGALISFSTQAVSSKDLWLYESLLTVHVQKEIVVSCCLSCVNLCVRTSAGSGPRGFNRSPPLCRKLPPNGGVDVDHLEEGLLHSSSRPAKARHCLSFFK